MSVVADGCQVILVDRAGRVLLQLRDDIESIPFPGMWAIPGGMLEAGESPVDAAVRELAEEMELVLDPADLRHVASADRSYGREHTFTARLDLDAERITLHEGQRVAWFAPEDLPGPLAYEDAIVLAEFIAGGGRRRPAV